MDRRLRRADDELGYQARPRPGLTVYRSEANPTASSRRDLRRPDAGLAGSGGRPTSGGSAAGVTSVTISSAIPYSSGSAPATTPPVRLRFSTPGPISLACPRIVAAHPKLSLRFATILIWRHPARYQE